MTDFSNPLSKIDYGHDYNFFKKLSSTAVAYNTNADVFINLAAPTYTVTFSLESGGPLTYSFNGYADHGDMTSGQASATLKFENRVISKIWFKGTGVVRIEAWAIR